MRQIWSVLKYRGQAGTKPNLACLVIDLCIRSTALVRIIFKNMYRDTLHYIIFLEIILL